MEKIELNSKRLAVTRLVKTVARVEVSYGSCVCREAYGTAHSLADKTLASAVE